MASCVLEIGMPPIARRLVPQIYWVMALLGTITDGTSTLEFYDQNDTPNARSFFSFVKWKYEPDPDLIRLYDFVAEPKNNVGDGIPGGKYPRKVDFANIIGYTPQADLYSGNINDPDFRGGVVKQCDLIQSSPPVVQFWYTTV